MKNDFREFYDEDYILHSMTEEEYLMHASGWGHKFLEKIRTASGKIRYIYEKPKNAMINDPRYVGKPVPNMNAIYQQEQKKASKGLKKYNTRRSIERKINQAKYDLGAAVSKITGKNKKFDQTAAVRAAEYEKKQKNKNAMGGDSRYKSKNAMAGDSRYAGQTRNAMGGDSRYTPSAKAIRERQLKNAKANQMYYDKGAQAKAKAAAAKKREDQYDFYLTQYGHGPKKYKKYGTKKKW